MRGLHFFFLILVATNFAHANPRSPGVPKFKKTQQGTQKKGLFNFFKKKKPQAILSEEGVPYRTAEDMPYPYPSPTPGASAYPEPSPYNNEGHAQSLGRASATTVTSSAAINDDYERNLQLTRDDLKRKGLKDRFIFQADNETIFGKVARPGEGVASYGTGGELLNQLKLASFPYPENKKHPMNQCIADTIILTHGWGPTRMSGGNGIPNASGSEQGYPVTGFYLDHATRLEELNKSYRDIVEGINAGLASSQFLEDFKKNNGRYPSEENIRNTRINMLRRFDPTNNPENPSRISTDKELFDALANESMGTKNGRSNSIIMEDLRKEIAKGDIKFCNYCDIKLYSCNITEAFIDQLALTTGCRVTYGTGMVSGKSSSQGNVELSGYRSSTKVEENGKTRYDNLNTRDGQFVRVTPIKGSDKVSREKMGTKFTLSKSN